MSSEEGIEELGSFAWRRLEGDMRTVGRDSEACHVAELPQGRLRTATVSSRETDWTQATAASSMVSAGEPASCRNSSLSTPGLSRGDHGSWA